jgi:pyridoxamine 5'-phosphate oxidase
VVPGGTHAMMAADETDLTAILSQCWTLLGRGSADRRHGFHHPVVSSVSAQNEPRSRVVILRAVNVDARILRFHTDIRSAKWQDLAVRPSVCIVFYDEGAKVQLRVDGIAKLHHADDVAEAGWAASQRMSRVGYGIVPGPGQVIEQFDAFVLPDMDDAIADGKGNFGVVAIHIKRIEWLALKALGNRRALFDVSNGSAQWLVP